VANQEAGQKKQANVELNGQRAAEEQSVSAGHEHWSKWLQLVAQVWADDQVKQRLLDQPVLVLREYGIEVPAGVEVRVVENTDKVSYLVLPAKHSGDAAELTAGQLSAVRGGEGSVLGTLPGSMADAVSSAWDWIVNSPPKPKPKSKS